MDQLMVAVLVPGGRAVTILTAHVGQMRRVGDVDEAGCLVLANRVAGVTRLLDRRGQGQVRDRAVGGGVPGLLPFGELVAVATGAGTGAGKGVVLVQAEEGVGVPAIR